MKRYSIYLSMFLAIVNFLALFSFDAISVNAATAVKGFNVSGTNLMDANGNVFVMRGVNHAHTWYKSQLNTVMPALAKSGCNTVRIVLSDGGQWTKDTSEEVSNIISLCEQNKIVAVLEVHDATGKDDEAPLLAAADYFVDIKDALIGKEDRVIINIANEWQGTQNSSAWAAAYKKAISTIRNAGLTHTILVDAGGWGQYAKSVHDSGKAVFDSDTLKNTMFAIHMYGTAGGNASTIKSNIDGVLNKGLALVIGEFGYTHSDGDVDEDTIMSYCKEKNVGWLAWSWKGNGSPVEYLDLSANWTGTNLSDWGKTIVSGTNGLKETSKICSVFEGSTSTITPAPQGLFGCYIWSKPSGYHIGTTSVKSDEKSMIVEFKNINTSDNAAGAVATIEEDWSKYEALSYAVTNPSASEIQLGLAITTGSNYVWHESNTTSIPAGKTKDITLLLNEAVWKTEASKWINNAKVSDLNKVQRIDFKIMSNQPVSGSIAVSNWKLGNASSSSSHIAYPSPIPAPGKFKVVGSNLFDSNGNVFIMRGVNHAHTWFKDQLDTAIPAIAKSGSNAVRIVLSNGTKDNWIKDDVDSIKNILDLCEENKLIAILEVHDALGVDSQDPLINAGKYFVEIKSALVGKEDKVIINIANEWFGSWSGSEWAEGYKKVIPIIRNAGLTHTIMVDSGGWGQYATSIHDYGKDVLAADILSNTMFSIHMYEYAGGTSAQIKANIDGVINQGLALCIGEFGLKHTDGDVDEASILSYCKEKGVGWLAWSWKGNGSGLEYLDLTNDWSGTNLTEFGKIVINGINGITETSKICSNFEISSNYLLGDVNGDETRDSADFTFLRRYLLQIINTFPTSTGEKAADINKDNAIDSADYTLLRKVLLDQIEL